MFHNFTLDLTRTFKEFPISCMNCSWMLHQELKPSRSNYKLNYWLAGMDLLSHLLPQLHFYMVCNSIVFCWSHVVQENFSAPLLELIAIFLLDSVKPGVRLSTSSPNVTRESEINIIVEFTKPVFGFEASVVEVIGGRITRQVLLASLQLLTQLYL